MNLTLHAPVSAHCSASSTRFSVQLLCKTPCRRLRTLERFKRQSFFNGTSFDLVLLQRQPVEVTDQCLDGAISGVRGNVKCTMKVEGFFPFFPCHCSGDSAAERETRSCRESTTRPHFVSAAPQGFRLWFISQPSRHAGHTPWRRRTKSPSCTSAWSDAPTATCSGKRPTERSVCVTEFTVWFVTRTEGLHVYVSAHFFTLKHRCGAPSKMSLVKKNAKLAIWIFILEMICLN